MHILFLKNIFRVPQRKVSALPFSTFNLGTLLSSRQLLITLNAMELSKVLQNIDIKYLFQYEIESSHLMKFCL